MSFFVNNMENGWIKLHRKFRENPIYKNSKAVHCWLECLLRANHKKEKYFLGRKQIELNGGEFIFGRDEFGKSIGISGSTIWFWLQRFEVDSMVDIKKTSKGCLCSIKNWNTYQEVDSKVDNKKTANKLQINTDKNDKNDKNIILAGEPAKDKEFSHIGNQLRWQSLAVEIVKKISDAQPKASSVFKCCKTNYQASLNAFNDCKEMKKPFVAYFLKVYNELNKK